MNGLPTADAATRAWFDAWLDRFAGFVREVDYASAGALFHSDVVAFGSYRDVIRGLAALQATQWENVWPTTGDFRFTLAETDVLASDDKSMVVVVALWTSTGFHPDGTRFERPGRATMIFHGKPDAWLCVHSHFSLNRGVPQSSHANGGVKAL